MWRALAVAAVKSIFFPVGIGSSLWWQGFSSRQLWWWLCAGVHGLTALSRARPIFWRGDAIQERQSSICQLRRGAHFVVCEVRQNRQAILRHMLALPARILQSPAEQLVELHLVLRPKHVAVAIDKHHRHRQLLDVRRPVVTAYACTRPSDRAASETPPDAAQWPRTTCKSTFPSFAPPSRRLGLPAAAASPDRIPLARTGWKPAPGGEPFPDAGWRIATRRHRPLNSRARRPCHSRASSIRRPCRCRCQPG